MIDWRNPYAEQKGSWLKGNLHAHTSPTSPCGRVSLQRVLELYERAGFDFLAISDHLHCTLVELPTPLITITGLEWNGRTQTQGRLELTHDNHLGLYCLDTRALEEALFHKDPREAMAELEGKQALVILNHPNWLVPAHYSEEDLFGLYQGASGMEICNAVVDRLPGSGDATLKWDRVLTQMGPFLGLASDDSHTEEDIDRGWLMVRAGERSPEAVMAGLLSGNFYCSTGVDILEIGREEATVFCRAEPGVHIEVSGENGQVLAFGQEELRFSFAETASSYLRFSLYGQGKQRAWSQPFFRQAEAEE